MRRVVAVEVATEIADKKWMSLQEVLLYTGLTKRMLETLRRTGKVKVARLSYRTYLYEVESLNNYIENKTTS